MERPFLYLGRLARKTLVIAAWIAGSIAWQEGIFLAEVFAWSGAALLLAVAYYVSVAKLKKLEPQGKSC